MPQWGLDNKQRRLQPWGIPEAWLVPGKVITDPVHGDIYLNKLEQAVVDSSVFQRLRRIRQLGTVHYVYPGATHTRFSHALGALRVVQDLLDIILAQRSSSHPQRDLFMQWEEELEGKEKLEGEEELNRRIAEVIVLARLGALLHDFCHVAYGHSIEDDLEILAPHDENKQRFKRFWTRLGDGDPEGLPEVQALLGGRLKEPLRALVLSKEEQRGEKIPPEERLRELGAYPFVADMVGNTICADLIDYLERDHIHTGLPAALGKRFMNAFYVVPGKRRSADIRFAERMALRVARNGRERKDVISELLKYLRFRYELQERAIVHHAKLAADAMLGKLLELWYDGEWLTQAGIRGGAEVEDRLAARSVCLDDVRAALQEDTGDRGAAAEINRLVGEALERRIRTLGDDGLLEFLHREQLPVPDSYQRPIRRLAEDLLARRLYKGAAQAIGGLARQEIYDKLHTRSERKRLEQEAARYAGISESHVAIWLPDPNMRMKSARVLVDGGKGILPFFESTQRGSEIYDDHHDLWTITVFVHESVRKDDLEPVVLAKLAELMDVEWDRHKPVGATHPADWPSALLAQRATKLDQQAKESEDPVEKELQKILEEARAVAYRSRKATFRRQFRELRRKLG